ncbi:MAG: arylsulfatase [Bacteroidales bacterium]|jgi:arylsulfatase B|nr:arylsulfatase [Bacteroidales bacterium]
MKTLSTKYLFNNSPLGLCLLTGLSSCTAKQEQQPPNIVIIVADDLGWNDTGFHNPDIISPHLDALAKKGVELSRFYVASISSPTRAGLLTGKYPDRFGIRDGVIRPNVAGGLPLEEKTLADLLGGVGYTRRGVFGKWHLGHSDERFHPLNRGFTEFYGHYNGALDYFTHIREGETDWHRNFETSRDSGYSVDLVAGEAARFIREAAKGQPFFAYVAFNGVHAPLQATEADLLQNGADTSLLSGKKTKETKRKIFSAMVTGLDRGVAEILRAIDDQDIADNTLIWFLSDNGGAPGSGGNNEPLRGAKNSEWEGGVRSVSLIWWKGKIEGGRKVDQVLSMVDVVPTLGRIAGVTDLPEVDGTDVLDAIHGKKLPPRILFLGRDALVTETWKLNKGELYYLKDDPYETTDVALSHPDEFKRLSRALKEFQSFAVTDPLPRQPEGWKPPKEWKIPAYH